MSTPRLFKFYLLNASGDYYYVNDDGNVQTTSTKTAIKTSPANWDKIQIQYTRDEKWYGIFEKSTAPLEFCEDGAKILRSIYYNGGGCEFDAYCNVVIEKRIDDGSENNWQYREFFNAEVDFSTENNDGVNNDNTYFSVRLLKRGLPEVITEKLETPYEIPLDGDAISVALDGIKLFGHYRWLTGDLSSSGAVTINTGSIGGVSEYFVVPMGFGTKEGEDYFKGIIYAQSQGYEIKTLNATPLDSNRLLATSQSFTVTLNLTATVIVDNVGGNTDMQFRIDMLKKDMSANANDFSNMLFTTSVVGGLIGSNTINVSVSTTLTFDPDIFSYYLVLRCPATSFLTADLTVTDLTLDFSFNTQLPQTTTDGFRYPKFAEKLVNKMTDGVYGLSSTYLNDPKVGNDLNSGEYYQNSPYATVIAPSDSIRGLTDAKITSSLSNMLQDCFSRWMCGMGAEGNNIRIERLPYFFQKDNVITVLSEVANFNKTTATSWVYNQIVCGYKNADIDQLNGRYEINSEQHYKLPIKRIASEKNLSSPYYAGIYDIEYIRAYIFGNNTTSSVSDNKNYLLGISSNIDGDGNYTLQRYTAPNTIFGAADSATHYNIGLSPHRFVLRHIPYLKSILNIPDGITTSQKPIKLTAGNRNTTARSVINRVLIEENGNIYAGLPLYTSSIDRLFIPIIFEFDTEPPYNLTDLVDANPYGVIGFYWQGIYLEGFILDIGINPGTNDTYHFRLLCSPNVNTAELVNI